MYVALVLLLPRDFFSSVELMMIVGLMGQNLLMLRGCVRVEVLSDLGRSVMAVRVRIGKAGSLATDC